MRHYLSAGVLLGLVLAGATGCMTESARRPIPPTINPPPPAAKPPDAAPAPPDGPYGNPPPTPDAPAGSTTCETPPTTRKNAGEPCICDNECSTGYCQEGSCCSGAVCGKRAPGAPCQRPDQCESGYCADGVCCNVACGGSCVSCNQPERTGECVPVPAGQRDPRETCRKEPEETCGQSGFCNGQGGCAKYAPGTACGIAVCAGPRTFVPAGECDGDGLCVKGMALECTPFTCEGASCRSSCVADADCVPPHICADGRCGLRGKGQACTANDQCQTGFCVDGVCCDTACSGRCEFCAQPNARGTCSQVRAGAPDPRAAAGITDPARVCVDQGVGTCGTNGRCDGRGGCQRYDNGLTCRPARCETGPNAETGPSICMNGSCRAPEAITCAPFRGCTGTRCITQCGSDGQCASGFFCVEGKCGKRPTGGVCSRGTDCVTGICAQGRCCASACNAPCQACNVAGHLGTCSPVLAGTEAAACGDPRCSACDGMGNCTRDTGAVCNRTCAMGSAVVTHTCTAEGACQPGEPAACAAMGQACRMGACACPGNQVVCAGGPDGRGICVNLMNNPQHCGACGTVCPADATCRAGSCACPRERPLCGNVCCDGSCIGGLCVPVGLDAGLPVPI
jgi:hypothetical protein